MIKRRFDDISPINLASSGRGRMGIPPLEPAHCDESNGGIFIPPHSLDAELIGEMLLFLSLSVLCHLTFRQIYQLRVVVGEWEDSSRRAGSNGGIPILL